MNELTPPTQVAAVPVVVQHTLLERLALREETIRQDIAHQGSVLNNLERVKVLAEQHPEVAELCLLIKITGVEYV